MEEYMDNYNYNQTVEPLFTKMFHKFHIYLGCGYT